MGGTYGTWLFAYTQLLAWQETAGAESICVVQLLEDAGACCDVPLLVPIPSASCEHDDDTCRIWCVFRYCRHLYYY